MTSVTMSSSASLSILQDPLPVFLELYNEVISLAHEAQSKFEHSEGETGDKAATVVKKFLKTLKETHSIANQVNKYCKKYDFSSKTRGNGHQSFVIIFERFLDSFRNEFKKNKKQIFLFKSRAQSFLTNFVPWINALSTYLTILKVVVHIHKKSANGELFLNEGQEKISKPLLKLRTRDLYGQCLGFQFDKSITKYVKALLVYVISVWNTFESEKKKRSDLAEILDMRKYMGKDEERGKLIEEIEGKVTLEFVTFFFQKPPNSILLKFEKFFPQPKPTVAYNIDIPMKPFQLETSNGTITISPLFKRLNGKPLRARLVSDSVREGMETKKKEVLPKSNDLIIAVHPGPLLSKAVDDNDHYTSSWSKVTGAPIVSIIYSNALDKKHPQQLEECFFSYCWIINNTQYFGSKGKNIILYGVSVGGTLALALMIKLLEKKVRIPNGCFFNTSTFRMNPISPSQLLAVMDGFIPLSTVERLMEKYLGRSAYDNEIDEHISPYFMSDDFVKALPPIYLLTSHMDISLDDNVEFAKRLKKLGKQVNLTIVPHLPHGFSALAKLNKTAKDAQANADEKLNELLKSIK